MNVLAHHEALLIVQATAGLTIAGATASLWSTWARVQERLKSKRIITAEKTWTDGGGGGQNEPATRIGAEPDERGQ